MLVLMTTVDSTRKLPLEEAQAYIEALDFDSILNKLLRTDVRVPYSTPWDEDVAIHAIKNYRRFLLIWRKYKYDTNDPTPLTPTLEVDEIWHNHILHTTRYSEDCAMIFGEYHHHYPYFGIDGADRAVESETLATAMRRVQMLFLAEFGEPLLTLWTP